MKPVLCEISTSFIDEEEKKTRKFLLLNSISLLSSLKSKQRKEMFRKLERKQDISSVYSLIRTAT